MFNIKVGDGINSEQEKQIELFRTHQRELFKEERRVR